MLAAAISASLGAPVIAAARLRGGNAGSARGAALRDIDQKRKTTQYLHLLPELAGEVPEVSHTLKP